MSRDPSEIYVVEYPCELHCSVEIDLTERHIRYTRGQMQREAADTHKEMHDRATAGAPVGAAR